MSNFDPVEILKNNQKREKDVRKVTIIEVRQTQSNTWLLGVPEKENQSNGTNIK